MDIRHRDEDGISFLTLNGQLETFSLPTLSKKLEQIIDEGGRRVCMNFCGVSFINSTALGYLVEASKKLKDLGGELVFSEPSRFFADTVRTLELHLLFDIFPTDDDAAAYFAAGAA